MGIFDFLGGLPILRPLRFQRYPDSFASTRSTLYEKLPAVIKSLLKQNVQLNHQSNRNLKAPPAAAVFIAAHFPDEFFRLQNELDQHGIEYQIIMRPLDAQWFLDCDAGRPIVYLALAELLTETTFSQNEVHVSKLDLIVVDRHPEPLRDVELETFARRFPAMTRMGYFLALDDRVLRPAINETTLIVLKQMGIDEHGLVSSGIISKRINKVLARKQKLRTVEGLPTDSAEQWFEINDET